MVILISEAFRNLKRNQAFESGLDGAIRILIHPCVPPLKSAIGDALLMAETIQVYAATN